MFHLQDGLYFDRLEDGKVRILKKNADTDAVEMDMVVDAAGWCSVIASMSYYGEEDCGFYRAEEFHQKKPVPDTCPLVDKEP